MWITLALILLIGSPTVRGFARKFNIFNDNTFLSVLQNCLTENDAQIDNIYGLVDLDRENPSNVSESVKCTALCFYKANGFSNSKGNMVDKAVLKEFHADSPKKNELDKAVDECVKDRYSDPCDNAYQTFHCLAPYYPIGSLEN